jgi:membrane protease subunit (stomatin/prohibitin family)
MAGVGAQVAAGAAIGQSIAQGIQGANANTNANANANAAPASASEDYASRLKQLKRMLDDGLVTADEYERAKADILAKLTR